MLTIPLGNEIPDLEPDPMRCMRKETVSKLWERIQKHHVVHIRATPGSGKSTLSCLLADYAAKTQPSVTIRWCSWPPNCPELLQHSHQRVLNHIFEVPPNIQAGWLTKPVLLIIDEAQASYKCSSLWNDFIKSLNSSGTTMVILFSSWGSATSYAEVVSSTPVILGDGQRISIRPRHDSDPSAFFTFAELTDVVERAKRRAGQFRQAFRPDPDVVNYIWTLTNGHPGAVREVLDLLVNSEVSILADIYVIFPTNLYSMA
jgi:hypothetical protein